ncbi:hypothetical protein HanXRQr2_Chr13g0614841 [Helianthus annuus]|uniref:Transmembrane protein n=1 Tax=Helianthus annuus TaxID=4232 RepID=A0A9K3ELS3_HELAN|nr:hypothetical protein HanXRQr2_Chr13g0614841 [Helianthus annuus]
MPSNLDLKHREMKPLTITCVFLMFLVLLNVSHGNGSKVMHEKNYKIGSKKGYKMVSQSLPKGIVPPMGPSHGKDRVTKLRNTPRLRNK